MLGCAVSASGITAVMSGCRSQPELDWTPKSLSPAQVKVTTELADTILPATNTPGAKEAKVEVFIDTMIAEFLTESEVDIFLKGLDQLHSQNFSNATNQKKIEMIEQMVAQSKLENTGNGVKPFFLLAKEMILLGFFTSEVGATQVLNYDPIPEGYWGCIPLNELGGKSWAT